MDSKNKVEKSTDKEIGLSPDKYAQIIKSLESKALISITDKFGVIVYINEFFREISGYEYNDSSVLIIVL